MNSLYFLKCKFYFLGVQERLGAVMKSIEWQSVLACVRVVGGPLIVFLGLTL